jgi:uncharacterized peroxidase-related enzyme
MAYIKTIDPGEASGVLKELYGRFSNPDGTVDNVIAAHSLNPASLEAHLGLYVQAMHKPGALPRVERELAGVIVSMVNGCQYCLTHHARGLRRLLPEDRRGIVDEILARNIAGLTDREQAIVGFAEALTARPAEVTRDDIDGLRAHGFDDVAVLDLVQVVGYFAYANRVVLGLGVELEERGNE